MSNLTNHGENKLADMIRGQAWSLPGSFYVGLASAAADGSLVELGGTGYGRVPVPRALSAWAGTQAPASVTASSGTSRATSNNATLDFGAAGSNWGVAACAVLFDAASSGNGVAFLPLPTSVTINGGDAFVIAGGALSLTLGLGGGASNYLSNKLIDFILRGQAFSFPTAMHAGLLASGAEFASAGGYARAAIACSLTAWSGTQGAGSTSASTGTSGRISNNAALAFPEPTAPWGMADEVRLFDAASAGNVLFLNALASPKTVGVGNPASFAADAMEIVIA